MYVELNPIRNPRRVQARVLKRHGRGGVVISPIISAPERIRHISESQDQILVLAFGQKPLTVFPGRSAADLAHLAEMRSGSEEG